MSNQKHEFAFYLPSTTELLRIHTHRECFILKDPSLYHLITDVLRLSAGEHFILFDQANHAQCLLKSTQKKNIIMAELLSFEINLTLKPTITFFLPLLKREAFQEAIYSLTELGATVIQPITTANTQRAWGGNREYERLERIVHAAAEQSKNFAFPVIAPPLSPEQALTTIPKYRNRFYFDPAGHRLFSAIENLKQKPVKELVLMVGPEADLTSDEKNLLHKYYFIFYRLTPTILRAQQAAAISLGIFRSLLP